MEQLLKPAMVAEAIGISISTLYQLVHERRIPFQKVGHKILRFRASELENWLKHGGAGPCHRQRPAKRARKLRATKTASASVDAIIEQAKAEAES